jgi:hypothetical protein
MTASDFVTFQYDCFTGVLFLPFNPVSRPDLVPWLQEQIAEQKRIDAETSGTTILPDNLQGPARSKICGPKVDVQLVLPGDVRKQRKQTKQLFLEKGENSTVRCLSLTLAHTLVLLQRSKWVCGSPLLSNQGFQWFLSTLLLTSSKLYASHPVGSQMTRFGRQWYLCSHSRALGTLHKYAKLSPVGGWRATTSSCFSLSEMTACTFLRYD